MQAFVLNDFLAQTPYKNIPHIILTCDVIHVVLKTRQRGSLSPAVKRADEFSCYAAPAFVIELTLTLKFGSLANVEICAYTVV